MAEILDYKCPNCSAPLIFDSKSQKMMCEFCGSSYTLEELELLKKEEPAGEPVQETASSASVADTEDKYDAAGWQTMDMQGMKALSCPSCGAEVVVEESVGALKCPYCDNTMIVPKQFAGMDQPEFVIPFKLNKQDAIKALKSHYLNKPLLPKVFKDENHMEEVKAVYVPFWLFDVQADGDFEYEGTRVHMHSDANYDYTETSYFHVERAGTMNFEKIPVDGSLKIDDVMMEAIEPYDYSELVPFQTSYLSGYIANKHDVDASKLQDRIHERMKASMRIYFQNSVDEQYHTLVPHRQDIRITRQDRIHYALLPVWFLNTKWNGKRYYFAMNGQTGKMIGDLPIGKDLMAYYWMKRHIPMAIGMTAVLCVLRMMGVI